MPMIIIQTILLLFLVQPVLGVSASAATKEIGTLIVKARVSEACTTTKTQNTGSAVTAFVGSDAGKGLGVSVNCLKDAPFMVGLGAPQPAIASQLSAIQGHFTLSSLRAGVVAISITY